MNPKLYRELDDAYVYLSSCHVMLTLIILALKLWKKMNIRKKCVNTSFVIFAKNRNGLTLVKNVSINELSEKPTNISKYLKNDSFEYFAIFEGNFFFFFFFFSDFQDEIDWNSDFSFSSWFFNFCKMRLF